MEEDKSTQQSKLTTLHVFVLLHKKHCTVEVEDNNRDYPKHLGCRLNMDISSHAHYYQTSCCDCPSC